MVDLVSPWSLARPGVLISESAPAISVLRVARDDAASAGRLGSAFGFAWPVEPNTVVREPLQVAWMAPGQWAVFSPAASLASRVAEACGDLHHLADVTAGRRLWRIDGVHARTVLARGCSLDTHPDVLPVGRCARTLFAQVPILLIATAGGEAFEMVADVSYAGHLRAWFAEATLERP